MKPLKNVPAFVLAILLAVCLLTYYSMRDSANPPPRDSAAAEQPLVDTSLLQTAVKLAPFAATPDEQAQAHEAWRLADHALDLTFAAALREAQAEAELPANGPLRELADRIAMLKERVQADKRRVEELGSDTADKLDRARAQLDLDQDELDDAQQDLMREGGDKSANLQRLLQERDVSNKVADQTLKFGAPGAHGNYEPTASNVALPARI